jgi:hypothetical protein
MNNKIPKEVLSLRLSVPLIKKIVMDSKSLNMSKAEYVSGCINNAKLNYRLMRKDMVVIGRGVKKIGNNINQIAHVLNTANITDKLGDIEYDKLLDKLLDIELAIKELDNEYN